MNSGKSSKDHPTILGIVTVNDKGQVVIPVSARSAIDIEPGDKLLVMMHKGHDGVVLIKPDGLEEMANHMLEQLNVAKNNYKEGK
jgi:AbrB family looped-hinge helix DNA binding protein